MWFPRKLVAAGHNSQNNQLGRYSGGINRVRPAGAPISKQFHFSISGWRRSNESFGGV
jgi:hypothetical protein